MKNFIIIVTLTLTIGLSIHAQNNIDNVLIEIEKNNASLLALKKNIEAEKIGNNTGIYLQNPEVEFNYLWGNQVVLGNRTDISVVQTFDFPTTYAYKNKIAGIKDEQLDYEYLIQKKEILHEAKLICLELTYKNALKSELSKRLVHAKSISNSYKRKLELGETNILEYNKAMLNFMDIKKDFENAKIESELLLNSLTRLNGGITIVFSDSVFQQVSIISDFDQWYKEASVNNPVLIWLQQEIEISQKEEKLNKAMSLPKLQAGYMSEKTIGDQFQGVTVGVSIPMWENKNNVKYAEAKTIALQGLENDKKLQLYNHLKSLHTKAIGLQKQVEIYRNGLQLIDNTELLNKALDKGEISILDYMLEQSIYYESIDSLFELERQLHETLAELNQYL